MQLKRGHWLVHEECIAHTAVGLQGTSRAEAMSNSENIKLVALGVIELCLAEGISQSVSQSVSQVKEIKILWQFFWANEGAQKIKLSQNKPRISQAAIGQHWLDKTKPNKLSTSIPLSSLL